MTNLTPAILRLLIWATIIFLVVIILTKSVLFASIAEIVFWCIVTAVRSRKSRHAS